VALKVLIVDDEALARARLRTLLGDCTAPAASVEAEAANAAQALAWLQHHPLPQPPVVVFVTAFAEHAVQAFEVEAVDYLTKPVRLERLQLALQKIERTKQAIRGLQPYLPEEVLIIQDRGRTERVPLTEVLYLKAELKYITVRTAARSYLLEGSLSELEDQYKTRFVRIHRNALIARRAVRSLEKYHDPQEGEGWAVRLNGIDELLWVSRRQLAAVRELVLSRCS
jgi:two-component system response regulator AlgR